MYKTQAPGGDGAGAAPGASAGAGATRDGAQPGAQKDNVVDAEFVDVEDKK